MSDEPSFKSLGPQDKGSRRLAGHPDSLDSPDSPDVPDSLDSLDSPDSRLPTHDSRLPLPVVMSVGGFDPSGGAGILADIKTIAAMHCYGVASVTSLTVQNTVGVYGVYHQTAQLVGAQMHILFDDFDVRTVKTGMLPSAETVKEVARQLVSRSHLLIVVDPVMRSS